MKRVLLASTIALASIASIGCDPSEPVLYEPTYLGEEASVPIPEVDSCSMYAQNLCSVLRPCCVPSPFGFEESKCRLVARSICEAHRTDAHNAGLNYDERLAGICISGLATLIRDCDSSTDVLADDPNAQDVAYACAAVFHGNVPVGRSCDPTQGRPCLAVEGERIDCVSGACIDQSHSPGDPCPCPSCAECGAFLRCNASSQCSSLHHPAGGACSSTDLAQCVKGTECSCGGDFCREEGLPTTCQLLPVEGEDCVTSQSGDPQCAPGYRCDTTGTVSGNSTTKKCVVGHAIGDPCANPSECASGACQTICVPSGIVNPYICSGVVDIDETAGITIATATTTGTPTTE